MWCDDVIFDYSRSWNFGIPPNNVYRAAGLPVEEMPLNDSSGASCSGFQSYRLTVKRMHSITWNIWRVVCQVKGKTG